MTRRRRVLSLAAVTLAVVIAVAAISGCGALKAGLMLEAATSPPPDLAERVAESEASPELEDGILEFGRQRLARYKVPRSVHFERELPRHPTGKLLVRRLRERHDVDGAASRRGRA